MVIFIVSKMLANYKKISQKFAVINTMWGRCCSASSLPIFLYNLLSKLILPTKSC